jgi:16S rRNA (guanine527-N7)-methyltransferase
MTLEREINDHFPDLNVSRETFERFKIYQSQITEWNKAFSLIQDKTIKEFGFRHVIDSLQIIKFIPNLNSEIIDIGTGAGFPGMVLAMYGYAHIMLVESNKKKTIFLEELARKSNTHVIITNDRAEKISKNFDFVVSRACSSLVNLLSLMKNVSRETTQGIFHKGESYMAEIEEAKKQWKFDFDLYPSLTEPKSKIIIIKSLESK